MYLTVKNISIFLHKDTFVKYNIFAAINLHDFM